MRSRRLRRRSGLVLSGLFLFQGLGMPLGMCAQGHEDHASAETAHDGGASAPAHDPGAGVTGVHDGHMTAGSSAARGEAAEVFGHDASNAHVPTPAECVAMSGCGAPALCEAAGADLPVTHFHARRTDRVDSGGPLAVDLGITTPPPKI
jgi:hypothetical protein